jgi:hypothetical protein
MPCPECAPRLAVDGALIMRLQEENARYARLLAGADMFVFPVLDTEGGHHEIYLQTYHSGGWFLSLQPAARVMSTDGVFVDAFRMNDDAWMIFDDLLEAMAHVDLAMSARGWTACAEEDG